MQQSLSPKQILQAFEIIINPLNSRDLIKQADTFLQECEKNQQFAIVLMQIFSNVGNRQSQRQIIIHLKYIIKRNWTAKRRTNQACYLTEQTKNQIKNGMIDLYKSFWLYHYKEFNEIFKLLAKYQFPSNYPSLKQFIIQILTTLANTQLQSLIAPPQLLPYLSLVKAIFKQNANRRFMHNRDSYSQHIAEPTKLATCVMLKLNNVLQKLNQITDLKVAQKLLECSRKVDKIVLYCLQSAVGNMQGNPQIIQIIQYQVNKIQMLMKAYTGTLKTQIQLNVLAIIQGLARLQSSLPFAFTQFLTKYLHTIINLLINSQFKNQKLTCTLVIANTKPLITFAYYTSESQFKQSIQCKKGNGTTYCQEQLKCHQQFISVYGGANAVAFLQKAIQDLMVKYQRESMEDQALFQDTENHQDVVSEYPPFQLLLIMIRNLILRFKEEFKPFILKIFDHLLLNKICSTSSKQANNMYQIILLLPKVYDQLNLNLHKVFELMQLCFSLNDYSMFSRLIRHYNSYFTMSMVGKSFQILINIIASPQASHQIMFQCAVCIKKILNEHEEQELPLQNLGLCLKNLLGLVSIYKQNPNHLWNILQLLTEILKMISSESVLNNLPHIINNIDIVIQMKDNDSLTVQAMSDLLQNVLQLIVPEQAQDQQILEYLYEISVKLVGMHLCNSKIQSPQVLLRLWLAVMRNVYVNKCSHKLTQKLVNALHTLKQQIIAEDPILFLELTEEYVLGGLISLGSQDVMNIASQILQDIDPDHKNRTLMALFSLHFSHFLVTNTLNEQMFLVLFKTIAQLQNKISQQTNTLRTFAMLIINHHIIVLSPRRIFQLLNSAYNNDYVQWFWPYVWSLEYVNHKYACKVASIAMLNSVQVLSGILLTQIQQVTPLQKILKAISFQVEPMTVSVAINSYMNAFRTMVQPDQKKVRTRLSFCSKTPRKYKLHINKEWAESDLSQAYRDVFVNFLGGIGWGEQEIQRKFDKLAAGRILGLLTGNTQEQKPLNIQM